MSKGFLQYPVFSWSRLRFWYVPACKLADINSVLVVIDLPSTLSLVALLRITQ
jgi:hypothetical protein